MLTNKKELIEIKEKLTEVNSKINQSNEEFKSENSRIFNENKELLNSILLSVDELNNGQNNLSSDYQQEINKTSELNEQLKKRIDSFKLLQESVQKRMMEDIKFEIKKHIDTILSTTERYKELEGSLVLINKKVENLTGEIGKFQKIAQEVKSADFELTKFAKQVTQEDQEKLRLMRENEKLKMLNPEFASDKN